MSVGSSSGSSDLTLIFFRYKIAHHCSIGDRIRAARYLTDNKTIRLPGTLVLDSMSNMASREYGAIPRRLCVLLDGVVEYCGPSASGPYGYNIKELQDWLTNYTAKEK